MKTTNFEVSKMLKEAGFEAKSCGLREEPPDCGFYHPEPRFRKQYPAYDLETILDSLREKGYISLYCGSRATGINFNNKVNVYLQENESLADTAGRMWLLLKEKWLV